MHLKLGVKGKPFSRKAISYWCNMIKVVKLVLSIKRFYMHSSRVLYFKIPHARQSKISRKLLPCSKP